MSQLSLALQAKKLGLQQVELNNQEFVSTMRGVARMLCRQKGRITADDLREWAKANGVIAPSKYAWGAIFHSKDFVSLGFIRSRQVSGHGNILREWALKEGV